MDIPTTSAAAAALRVGLNIVVGRRRPEIEFYFQVHNEVGPPTTVPERTLALGGGFKIPARERRTHDAYVSFYAVNIGSVRAQEITFSVNPDFANTSLGKYRRIFDYPIRQMAPGQSIHLFRLRQHEIFSDDREPSDITVTAAYGAAPSWINWIPRKWAALRKKPRYSIDFVFNGRNIATDLPPPNYNG